MALPNPTSSPQAMDFASAVNTAAGTYADRIAEDEAPYFIDNSLLLNKDDQYDFVGDGVRVFINQDRSEAYRPATRNITSMSPEAVILIKKKAFSGLRGLNDLQWMDKTERMLLRATKALFAYKTIQIKTYESLTKLESYYETYREINLLFFAEFLYNAQLLALPENSKDREVQNLLSKFSDLNGPDGAWTEQQRIDFQKELGMISEGEQRKKYPYETEEEYQSRIGGNTAKNALESTMNKVRMDMRSLNWDKLGSGNNEAALADVYSILKRNAFTSSAGTTTWIVDPSDTDNFETGPGTGVIELTLFNSFTTSCQCDSPNPNRTNFSISDPYGMLTVIENDIELAISEAISGTVGVLASMSVTDTSSMVGQKANVPMIDGASVASAALEMMGLGSLDDTLDIDYIRERLRVFYLGKPFINAGDGISIFINGNRKVSDYSQGGNSVNSLSLLDEEESSIDEIVLEAERKLYTKGNLDLETYIALRDHSALSMTCVFTGLVSNTSQSYSSGFHNLSINCSDNMEWLNWSRVIEQPSFNEVQGILEEPMTPFNLKTDTSGGLLLNEAPELLYENKMLIKSGLLSYGSGILGGQIADESTLFQGQYNLGGSLYGSKIINPPNGFVYRWKTGIVTATADLTADVGGNDALRNWNSWSMYQEAYGVPVTVDVFNNIDVANVLSMLIVGQPYNAESFIEQAHKNQGLQQTSSSSLSVSDPLYSVLSATRKQNDKFGRFKPYRLITMSTSSIEKLANNSLLKTQTNTRILNLQKRKAEIRVLINKLSPASAPLASNGPIVRSLYTELHSVNLGIQNQLSKTQIHENSLDNVGYETEFNLFGESQDAANAGNYEASHQLSRAMTFVGAQRRVDSTRMNNDHNYFIVSDQYDGNAEIKSFIFQMKKGGWNTWKGSFVTSYQKCVEASNILGLEFFCNTQGHLELRPPLWNRIPLSVLEEYIAIQKKKGENVLPEFLTSMFTNRIDAIKITIHTLNVKIALIALLLGFFPDSRLIPGMTVSGSDSLQFFGIDVARQDLSGITGLESAGVVTGTGGTAGVTAVLMTERLTGGVFNKLLTAATKGANLIDAGTEGGGLGFSMDMNGGEDEGDILEGDTTTMLGDFDPITQEASPANVLESLFPIGVKNVNTAVEGSEGSINVKEVSKISIVSSIRQAFKRLTGKDVLSDIVAGKEVTSKNFAQRPADHVGEAWSDLGKETMKFTLLRELQVEISSRDSAVSTLQRNLAKQEELEEIERFLQKGEKDELAGIYDIIDDEPGTMQWKNKELEETSDKLLYGLKKTHEVLVQGIDIMTGDTNEGSLWDHIIQDDHKHWLGPGSGKRFVIRDDQIISSNFTETVPQYTRVDVIGDAPIIGATINEKFEGLAFWAGATDFDLWRQYGYKRGGDVKLNFAHNAELQCKPYAILLLQLQRARINSGSVEVVGNPYYQPGDVVFVPYRGLLYYVTSVSHGFRMGGTFTTRLSLTNGHPVGVYLPSPFDVVGQNYVGDPLKGSILSRKSSGGDDAYRALQPDSTIIFPSGSKITEDKIATLLDYQNNQLRFYNMMLDLSSSMLGDKYVVIRGFYGGAGAGQAKGKGEDDVRDRMEIVRQLLINPVSISQGQMGIFSVGATGSPVSTPDISSEGPVGFSAGVGLALNQQTSGAISSAFGTSVSLGKSVETMILPNGSLARAVPDNRIILQLVNLEDKKSVQYDIRCMNRQIFETFQMDIGSFNSESKGKNVKGGVLVTGSTEGRNSEGIYKGKPTSWEIPRNKLPVDGPRQATWLHLRKRIDNFDYESIGRAIEIGIVDLS